MMEKDTLFPPDTLASLFAVFMETDFAARLEAGDHAPKPGGGHTMITGFSRSSGYQFALPTPVVTKDIQM